MSKTLLRSTFEMCRTWRRQLGVVLCIVALAFTVFGHSGSPEAGPLEGKSMIVELLHAQGAGHHDAEGGAQHCMHQSQCTVQAVLPSEHFPDGFGLTRARLAADLLGSSRAVSPRRHPPKTSFLS